jgi:alkylmercury lyase
MIDTKAKLESARAMMDSVPTLDADAKRLAVELYKQLALGEPVRIESLCDAMGAPIEEITTLLQDEQLKGWVFYDDEGRVIGFRGLAVREMPHRFEVDGRTLYTWCAIDSLFIPEMLGKSASVESRDPHTGTVIKLTVSPDGVKFVEPANAVMSILIGDTEVVKTEPTRVMASFCHHIFFLESAETGAEWAAQHGEGTFLVTLDDGFALGKRLNAAQFDG